MKINKYLASLLFILSCFGANAQVSLTLDYKVKALAPTSVKSGEYWTMQLDYAISSTTIPNISGVKIEIPLPDLIENLTGFVGTTHAPAGNFVFTGTPGAKKLTVNFTDPVATGSSGVLEFQMRTMNGATPDGTLISTCATMTDGAGNTSGAQCSDMTITAQNLLCGFKSLKSGGAVGTPTTYRILLAHDPVFTGVPLGALNASTISITDTYPAGATYISAQVINGLGMVVPSTITTSGNTVTATISNYTVVSAGVNGWNVDYRVLEVTVQYNTPPFSIGQSVTNTATVTLTPLGQAPVTLVNGSSNSQCTSDLIETHTLQDIQRTAALTKTQTSGALSNVSGGTGLAYDFDFTNTGNVALNNVEIIETVPADLIYAGMRMDAWGFQITGLQYQTNLNATWTTWPGPSQVSSPPPPLAAGEKVTLIKWILVTPFNSMASLGGTNQITFTAGTVAADTPVTNCMEWNATDPGLPASRQACNSFYTIIPPATTAGVAYSLINSPGCPGTHAIGTEMTLTGTITAATGLGDIQNPVVGILVRNGAQYVAASQTFSAGTSGIVGTPTFTLTPNHRTISGVSYDLLRWTFPSGTVVPAGTDFSVGAKVTLTNLLPPGQAVEFLLVADGSNISSYNPAQNANITFVDSQDWDGDANTAETVKTANAGYNSCTSVVGASAEMESIKWVKGLLDTTYSRYPDVGQTVPGGNADYKLIVTNTGNIAMTNVIVVDILPFVGDAGVVTFPPRNTEWRPNLAGPITGTGATVYYSTSGNPCRPELGITVPGCTVPNWSTTPPSDITTVQSVKLEFGSALIQPGQAFEFNWPMRAPVTAPTNGEIAWNSFGFTATRTDNNQPLLAAEPPKVGIRVQAPAPAFYGDRVWYDLNENGIQDVGEAGVNGIKVKLFSPRVAGVQNPATDSLINFTITANGGFYRFSNLRAGNYYAVFCLPTGYLISPKNAAGSTINNDSDGTPTTYEGDLATIVAITNLTANEEDYTWDQGIFCQLTPSVTPIQTVALNSSVTLTASGGTTYLWSGPNGFSATTPSITINPVTPADTGTYTVNIEQGACRASLITGIKITSCIKPVASMTPKTQTVCVGAIATAYTATPSTGVAYQWYGPLADTTSSLGTIISGQTTASYTPTGAALTTAGTKYYAVVVNTIGDATCADTAFVRLVVNSKPIAGVNQSICAPATTATLTGFSPAGGTWSAQAGNPSAATVTNAGAVSGLTGIGTYQFIYTVAGCTDTVAVVRNAKPNAGTDRTLVCSSIAPTTADLADATVGQKWKVLSVQPNTTVTVTTPAGAVSGMTVPGTYQFVLQIQSDSLNCRDTVSIIVPDCVCPTVDVLTPNATVCKDSLFPTLSVAIIGSNTQGVTAAWYANATGGSSLSTGLNFKPTGIASVTDTFYVQLNGVSANCQQNPRTAVVVTVQNCKVEVDLALKKSINKKIAQIGDVLTYTLKVWNESNTNATGVEVTDSIATTVQFQTGSFMASRGTATITGHVITWNIGNIAANGDTLTLTYQVKATQEGVHFNTAEICKTNEKDVDSTPCNHEENEDDFDRQCFTVPVKLCPGEKVEVTVPAHFTNVQWFKNGSSTVIGSGNVILLSEVGIYTFTATNQTCPANGCCPILIETGINCCPEDLCIPFTIKQTKKATK